jgi:RHS repeat-associated protein
LPLFTATSRRRRSWKPWISGVTAAAVVATFLQVAVGPAVPAAAEPAKKQPCPASRPDEAAALVTARICGGDVQITAQTNEYDQGVAQPNGIVRWEHHYRPVRIERDDAWIPVDTTLKTAADGTVQPAATAVGLVFSGGGNGPLVSVTEAGGTLKLGSPLGNLPAPVLTGDTATYPAVLPDVDLKLTADVDGFAQVLVVKTREAAANPKLAKLTFPLTTSGLTVTTDSAGNLRATDTGGTVTLSGNAPEMWDASAQGATGARATLPEAAEPTGVTKRLATTASKTQITVTPNQAMLDDPATVYPVYIDPGATATRSSWAKVSSANPTTAYWNSTGTAQVGGTPTASNKYRSIFNLNLGATPVPGKYVNDADFHITQNYALYCESHPVELRATGPSTSSTTWNNQPAWNASQGSVNSLAGCDSAHPGAPIEFDVTAHVRAAATDAWSNLSYGLWTPDEAGLRSYKEFSNNPYVTISYTGYAVVTSKGTLPPTTCATGTSRPYVNTKTPTLRVRVTDPEGATVRPEIEWDTLGGAKIGSAQPLPGNYSGALFAAAVPAGAFAEGGSYSWKARGFDSTVWGPWNSACEFTVDSIAPSAAPTVTSSTYPAGQWAGGAGTAGTFTFGAAGVTDVAAYEYGLDTNPPTDAVSPSATGGSASVSITPPTDGAHILYVRSRDRAGNLSPTVQYAFSVGSAAVTSPKPGDTTAADLALTASAKPAATGVTYQWRRGDADAWVTIPAGDVTQAVGGGAVTWPLAGSGSSFAKLNWNIAKTLNDAEAGDDPLVGPLQIRVLPNTGNASSAVAVTFDPNQSSAASAEVGPGSVNLLTGNLTLSDTDVSVDSYGSDLTVSRSYNTRRAAATDSAAMFGPGWASGVLVEEANADYTQLDVTGSLIQVGLPEGDTIGFTKRNATTFVPELGFEDLKLTYTASPESYILTDSDGNATTFTKITGSAASRYFPTAVSTPGSNQTSQIAWEKVSIDGVDRVRPTRLLAPVPSGVSCTTLAQGCRALSFTYATATTATGTNAATWGDYAGRVKEISFTAWDTDLTTPALRTIVMARYTYDNAGRLRAAWDPRLDWTDTTGTHHQQDSYDYNTDGVLSTITPNGQEPWNLTYTTIPGDAGKGRLAKATRSALAAGTATTTVVYGVPVSGANAPYDLSAAQTARWGQTEPPVRATAVYPPDQIPNGDQTTGTLPTSAERATVTYLDANAQAVNTVTPNGSTTSTWYDKYGNTVQTLTPGNRGLALDYAADDNAATEAALAYRVSTVNVYSADGQRLTDTYGPEHAIVLTDDSEPRGRTHTHNVYDENATATDNPYNLITTSTTTVQYDNNGVLVDAEPTTTQTEYNWTLRQPTRSTVDPGGLDLVTTTAYDTTTGLTTAVTTPAGASSTTTPATRKTTYYRAGTGSGYTECDNNKEWANLVCRIDVGGQPDSGAPIPATVTTYDIYNQPRTITEKTSSATLRTTSITYDTAGRTLTKTVAASGLGTAVPVARTIYDQVTGQATRSQSLVSGIVTAETVRTYDTLGRQTSYTDADGVTSTTTYDLLGRTATTNDGKATRTYHYDGGTERRGLLTSLDDSQAGTFYAYYDIDGQIWQELWPNGTTDRRWYDETGAPYGTQYWAAGCAGDNCVLYSDWTGDDARGLLKKEWSDLNQNTYQYDKSGRLIQAYQTTANSCTGRKYGFDDATNRTGISFFGACAEEATDNKSWTYDTANRVTNTGYAYDALGRTLTIPSADTGNGGGNATITYHATDLVDTITQNGRTTDYTLDVTGERFRSWADTATGATAHTNHYDGDDDNPSWTQENATSYSRPVHGIQGLTAIYTSTSNSISYQFTNLHDDVVATAQANSPGLSSTAVTDEYGTPASNPNTDTRYGWLGSKLRATDAASGIVLMGVRLYNASTGRFLQMDPIYGGNANDYEYCKADPNNCTDLDGKWGFKRPKWTKWSGWRTVWKVAAIGVGVAAAIGCGVSIVCGVAAGAAAGAMGYWGSEGKKTLRGTVKSAGWGAVTGFSRAGVNAYKVGKAGKFAGKAYRHRKTYSGWRSWRNLRTWRTMTSDRIPGRHRL